MTVYNSLARAGARIHCIAKRDKMFKFLESLERNQWRSRPELDEVVNRELSALMHHVYETVPYYRRVFDERGLKPSDIQCQADLVKLPALTKQIIVQNYDDLTSPAHRDRLEWKATGGSTGEPMRFALEPEVKQWGNAAKLRSLHWAGYHLGDKQVLVWGSTFDLKRFASLGDRITRWVNRTCLLNAHVMSDEICGEYVAKIRRFRPRAIFGYANSLFVLADYIDRNNITDVRPATVLSRAETLLPERREVMERAFQCNVYDGYASRETSLLAHQCQQKDLYHTSSDTTILEIIKDDRPAEPGEMGKVLLTDLKNYGMPFIRYQIEDMAVAGNEPCKCGRSLPTFKSIAGRMTDFIETPDGRVVHPTYAMYLFYPSVGEYSKMKGLRRYQIIQETETDLVILLALKDGVSPDEYAFVEENFRSHFGSNMSIEVRFVDDIPLGPSGKRRYVVNNVRRNQAAGPAGE